MKVEAVVPGTLDVKLAWLRLGFYHLNLEEHLIEALLTSFLDRGPNLYHLGHLLIKVSVIVSPYNNPVRKGLAAIENPDLPLGGFVKHGLIVKEGTGA